MSSAAASDAEVFSLDEIARAAGVERARLRQLIDAGRVRQCDGYLLAPDAVALVRALRGGPMVPDHGLFAAAPKHEGSAATGIAASGAIHAVMLGGLLILTTLGVTSAERIAPRLETTRMVFLATPGPGGGGGGGGLRQPDPPAKAALKGAATLKSPVPPPKRLTTRPPRPEVARPTPPPVTPRRDVIEPPPPSRPPVAPQVIAPVATAAADDEDRAGALASAGSDRDVQGAGTDGGVGSGRGTGIGEGTGAGIGPGSGMGTGGGPYRPGSGIAPPSLLREVRPDYTDDARRMGIEGDVVLEIVVRHDGTVGEMTVLRGLGGGLERRAMDAVRQWRFSPARRFGTPVDVLVEVAVEFRLR